MIGRSYRSHFLSDMLVRYHLSRFIKPSFTVRVSLAYECVLVAALFSPKYSWTGRIIYCISRVSTLGQTRSRSGTAADLSAAAQSRTTHIRRTLRDRLQFSEALLPRLRPLLSRSTGKSRQGSESHLWFSSCRPLCPDRMSVRA